MLHDGGGKEDHIQVTLAEVVWVDEEGGVKRCNERRVVGPRVGEEGVALPCEGARHKLPEVFEPDNGDRGVVAPPEAPPCGTHS